MKSVITNNISEVDKQKRKFSSDISDMRKSLNDYLDKIEKQTVEEMVSAEQNLQVELKKYWLPWKPKELILNIFGKM